GDVRESLDVPRLASADTGAVAELAVVVAAQAGHRAGAAAGTCEVVSGDDRRGVVEAGDLGFVGAGRRPDFAGPERAAAVAAPAVDASAGRHGAGVGRADGQPAGLRQAGDELAGRLERRRVGAEPA